MNILFFQETKIKFDFSFFLFLNLKNIISYNNGYKKYKK